MLVALIVNRAGQTDFTGLCWDGEQTAGIDEEAVADWFLLERYSRCDQKAVETWGESTPLTEYALQSGVVESSVFI